MLFVSVYVRLLYLYTFDQMPEEQAFCVLVNIMYQYGLRNLFRQGFEELHLRFYQLERLIQVLDALLKVL